MKHILFALALLVPCSSRVVAQDGTARYLFRDITVGPDRIVFARDGRLWTVAREGGAAQQLPIVGTDLRFPLLSPDGTQLAFMRDGALWVLDSRSGTERRLTWHPNLSIPRVWTPDGRRILFTATREGIGSTRAYEVDAAGGPERSLPFSPVRFAAFAPDGRGLAIIGRSHFALGIDRRFYRGGNRDPLLLVAEGTAEVRRLVPATVNLVQPLWVRQGLFVLSDSLGSFNLARVDLGTGRTSLITHWRSEGVTAAAANGDMIILVRDGALVGVDAASGRTWPIPVTFPPPPAATARPASLVRYASSVSLGPDGRQVAIESRGDVFTFHVATAGLRRLTTSSAVAERSPSLSPDGSRLAYFSDSGGAYALVIAAAGDGRVLQRHTLASPSAFYRELSWSPDGRFLAFSDSHLRLWVATLSPLRAQVVDSSRWLAQELWQVRWATNSRQLAYSKGDASGLRSIWLLDATTATPSRVTSFRTDDTWPVFNRDGSTLYYASSIRSGNAFARNIWALESDLTAQPFVSSQIMALRIADAVRTPRPLNVEPRTIEQMWLASDGALLTQVTQWPEEGPAGRASSALLRISPASGDARPLAVGLRGADVSLDGTTALLIRRNGWTVLTTDSGTTAASGSGTQLPVGSLTFEVDQGAEVAQLYAEAFRMMRDRFYDPALHGESITRLQEHAATYLPGLRSRQELNDLLTQAFGEISVSHLDVIGGDIPSARSGGDRVGLLGIDVNRVGSRFRVTKIHRPSPGLAPFAGTESPWAESSGELHVGDYVVGVDSADVVANRPFESYFVGTADREISLRVAPDTNGVGARVVRVRPVSDDADLRRRAWAGLNAAHVEQRSGGRVAYVYIKEWDEAGLNEFYRVFNSLRPEQGLIIDQRWNSGGVTPDGVIEALSRRPLYAYHFRDGAELPIPLHLSTGPKVLLTNEGNGSAAETFALMFRRARLGTIVGRRTGGGGIGASLSAQRLIDGGRVAIPNRAAYDPVSRSWAIENQGIEPDIVAELPVVQRDIASDLQLERALGDAMRRLPVAPRVTRPPAAPVHPVRSSAADARAPRPSFDSHW